MENKTLISLILIALVIGLIIVGWGATQKNNIEPIINKIPPTNSGQANKKMSQIVTLETSLGQIQFETYDQDAPKTVENFIKLANQGYYDGLNFHRVIKGFMIQGGDPNCSPESSKIPATGPCGTGGPGYQFADELNPDTPSYKAGYKKGVVAMANAGPNTNGSQFFIMLEDNPLPNNYTIFAKVIKGQEVVDKIGEVKTSGSPEDRPLETVLIKKVTVQ